jgi:predicted RNase H-like nuclease (RuvC/YqgF family)
MEKVSAQAEADSSEPGQTRGWMRSPLGRVLGEPLADLVSTARFLSTMLPEVARELRAIRIHVASMDPEMLGMHGAVQRIEGEITALNVRIEELSEHMEAVETAVTRLEPHIADVNLVMRPLRRARARLPTRATD